MLVHTRVLHMCNMYGMTSNFPLPPSSPRNLVKVMLMIFHYIETHYIPNLYSFSLF